MKRYFLLLLLLVALPVLGQKHQLRKDGRVLAHSLQFNPNHISDDMPVGLQEMLRVYQTKPRYAERQRGKAVSPLLKTRRHQEDPFNRSCPYYIYDDGHTSSTRSISGCVATCMEQVLTFYRYPEALIDTLFGWETEHYKIETVMPGTPIDWAHVLDDYSHGFTDEEAQAVADLTYYCGMAAHMNWSPSSSGANLGRAFEPLWRVFDYKTLAYVSRALYSTPAWNAMLRNELESGRPICYTGHNMALSGHAFNIDGVDEEGYYHLVWGYDGMYDGYFDLDYLNPFESLGNETEVGQNEGFFSNQTALFIHPEDFVIDIFDTLRSEVAFAGVVVEDIAFRRQPDSQGYVVADFSMRNTSADSLNFTFEVLTYLPTDTAIFEQADYVALSAVNLAPGERKTWPVYCQFTKTGKRILAFSSDDVTLPYKMDVDILQGTASKLIFGEVEYELWSYADNLVAQLSLDITNNAASGFAGDLVTYCLFPEGSNIDERHWEVLSLAAGDTHKGTIRFQHLEDGKTYTLRVRSPWTIRKEYTFTVNSQEAADGIEGIASSESKVQGSELYDLAGRKLTSSPHHSVTSSFPRGIYIKHGKKILIP